MLRLSSQCRRRRKRPVSDEGAADTTGSPGSVGKRGCSAQPALRPWSVLEDATDWTTRPKRHFRIGPELRFRTLSKAEWVSRRRPWQVGDLRPSAGSRATTLLHHVAESHLFSPLALAQSVSLLSQERKKKKEAASTTPSKRVGFQSYEKFLLVLRRCPMEMTGSYSF